MKKIINIILTFAALSFVSSCAKEEPHEPGPKDLEGCYDVFFPTQEASGDHIYDPSMEKTVSITVGRTNSEGDIEVPFNIVSKTPDMFKTGSLHFADGQTEATLDIDFPDIEEGVNYGFTVVVDDPKYASLYSSHAKSLDFSVMCVKMEYFLNPVTKEPAVFTFSEDWNGHVGTCKLKYYDVKGVRTCFTETDPYTDEDGTYTGFFLGGSEFSFKWYTNELNPDECPFVEIPEQDVQYHPNYETMVKIYEWYAYFTIVNPQSALAGMSWLDFAKKYNASYGISYYDNNGAFVFHTAYYYMIGIGGWSVDEDNIVMIADGFTRVDYSIEAETDYSYDGEVPVYFTTGADVAEIKYFVADAELTATQAGRVVDAILDGTQEGVQTISGDEIEFDEEEGLGYSGLSLSFEKSGLYSVVAVTFDEKGEGHESATVTVNYIAAEDEEANAVLLDVKAEAVPEMYGLDPYTTLAFRVSGQNLTEVHLGIFPAAKFDVNPSLYLSTLKYDAENYAVDEETLATINAMGGLYDYADKLTANTEYIVVAWATNGKLDAIAYDYYGTPRLPYVWNSLGKGVYTEDVVAGIYGYGATLDDGSDYKTFDVEVEVFQENTNKNLYMFDPSLAVAAKFFGVTETVMANYEGGNWRHAEIILDCTNPTSVIWEEQDYGVCLNSKDGFIDGVTNMYNGAPFSKGIFSNGVISFPTPKGMLCTIGGDGYYYADMSGKVKLVLPTSSKAAEAKTAVVPANNNSFDGKEFSIHNAVKAIERTRINIEREVKAAEFSASKIAPKMEKKAPIDKSNAKNIDRKSL